MTNIIVNLAILIITLIICYGAYRLLTRPTRVERWQRDTAKRMAHREDTTKRG